MKVGIITYHNAENFGAFLQCFALYKFLIQKGYEVEIVDYRQDSIERTYKLLNKDILKNKSFIQKLSGIKYLILNLKKKRIRKSNYQKIRKEYLKYSNPVYSFSDLPQNYDAIVIGSDQLWNVNYTGGIDSIYWGLFDKGNKKLIGYAISGNLRSIEGIDNKLLSQAINNFNALSVREQILADAIFSKTNIKPSVTLDPTLLLPEDFWIQLVKKLPPIIENQYILCYGVRIYNPNPRILYDKAQMINETSLPIIDLNKNGMYFKYNPLQFISLIYHANYVITSSFHGLVFSIIFKKKFFLITYDDGDDSRACNLLKSLSLQDHIFSVKQKLEIKQYNYQEAFHKLQELRETSSFFLSQNLRIND